MDVVGYVLIVVWCAGFLWMTGMMFLSGERPERLSFFEVVQYLMVALLWPVALIVVGLIMLKDRQSSS